mgnify:CR=1 FL=1
MEITITGRHFTVPEKFKSKIEKKISKLQKYNENIAEAKVILSSQKNLNTMEVVLLGKNLTITAKETTEQMADSLNAVIEKLEAALKKERELMKEHSKTLAKKTKEKTMEELLKTEERKSKKKHILKVDDYEILVKANELLKPISIEEAVCILTSDRLNFYAFNDINTGRVSIVYRKSDKNKLGLIEM